MPHNKAVRAPGKAAIGEQRHILAETRAHNRRRRRQHLRHARAAFRTFIANNDHVALTDLPVLERVQHFLFGVVDLGRPREDQTRPRERDYP